MYNGKLYKIKPLDITILVDFEIILNNKYLKNEILIMYLLTHGYPMKALYVEHNRPKGPENVKITTLYRCTERLFRAATRQNDSCCDL